MPEDTRTIEYTVRLSGDQWDHEGFREQIHEYGGEIEREEDVDAEDYTNFHPPDAEEEHEDVSCPNCGDVFPVSEAVCTADRTDWGEADNESGEAVASVHRHYVCSEECVMEMMGIGT